MAVELVIDLLSKYMILDASKEVIIIALVSGYIFDITLRMRCKSRLNSGMTAIDEFLVLGISAVSFYYLGLGVYTTLAFLSIYPEIALNMIGLKTMGAIMGLVLSILNWINAFSGKTYFPLFLIPEERGGIKSPLRNLGIIVAILIALNVVPGVITGDFGALQQGLFASFLLTSFGLAFPVFSLFFYYPPNTMLDKYRAN